MTEHPNEERFPAVDQLRERLRSDLLSAARANPAARTRFTRRQRLAGLAVVALMAAPAGLAVAGVFSSAEIEYECPAAEKLHEGSKLELGAPVEGPGAAGPVVEEELTAPPENPCDEEGSARRGAP